MQQFYDGVREIPGIKIYGDFSDPAAVRCPVVSLNIGDMDASEVSDWLQEEFGILPERVPTAHLSCINIFKRKNRGW